MAAAVGRRGAEIQIICGYRTPKTNEFLRAHTAGVAKHSLHMQAKAIDIRLPGTDILELRKAAFRLSGELKTLDGTFALDEMGGQIGELTPLGQLELEHERIKFISIYPHETATGKPVYPRP